ncbi:MAG: PepSY domain-containing protein [Clostridiales bacterium]|nr:PepSY domain-containing protein [Clostridiales bacterium]
MKKLILATIVLVFSIGLVACTDSGVVDNSNGNNSSINGSSDDSTNGKTSNKITIDQAKEIALKHAGLTKDQVSFSQTKNDIDDGIEKYDVEFNYEGKEYDYEISAIGGEIIKYDHEIEDTNIHNNVTTNTQGNTQNDAANNTSNNTNSTDNISVDKAKQIALSHAGLTSSKVTFKRTELDFDDGIQKYEVEFYYNNREYSYEINAKTGEILSYEQD